MAHLEGELRPLIAAALVAASTLGGLACGVSPGTSVQAVEEPTASSTGLYAPRSLLLNIAPAAGRLALAWSPPLGDATRAGYRVSWRGVGEDAWNEHIVHGRRQLIIDRLEDGAPVEVRVEALGDPKTASVLQTATPHPRGACSSTKARLFCSFEDAQAYLDDINLRPTDLRLRGHLVRWDPQALDGTYALADGTVAFTLLRSLDDHFAVQPRRPLGLIRRSWRRVLWPDANPFDHPEAFPIARVSYAKANVGSVKVHAKAESFGLVYSPFFTSRMTWFTPPTLSARGIVLFHHGHACAGSCTGSVVESDTIDWWLRRGWYVLQLDMPANGYNGADAKAPVGGQNKHDMAFLDAGHDSPLGVFLLPIKHALDIALARGRRLGIPNRTVMMGRSGGGWSTLNYAALDPRIDLAISVAGGLPMSMRMRHDDDGDPDRPRDIGDYEQMLPHAYRSVTYLDLMRTAGRLGTLLIHHQHDSCCFRLTDDDPFVSYFRQPDPRLGDKLLRIWVDENNDTHHTSAAGLEQVAKMLVDVFGPT